MSVHSNLLQANSFQEPLAIEGGRIAGAPGRDPRIRVYKGIPYAAAPVGALRWRPPQPVRPWNGVRQATSFAPTCLGRAFGPPPAEGMSEDCLYANVWAPAPHLQGLPVLVWIHGGGFQGGGGSHPSCDGEALAGQDIVVVTFNYRVGVLGFLAHPELTGESDRQASGNYGLLDQVAALEWVRRNIHAFGGDPAKVTIAGESAGAYSVSALTASPLARGLFRGAIAQSGGFLSPKPDAMRTLAQSEALGVAFAALAGAGGMDALRAMSGEDLIRFVAQMPDPFAFSPGLDGAFLSRPVHASYADKAQARIPILIGANTDEGAFLMSETPQSREAFQAQLARTYGANSRMVQKAYPTGTASDLLRSVLNLHGDGGFTHPMWKWAILHQRAGLPVFRYIFGRTLPPVAGQTYRGIPRHRIGAFHGDEVAYVFGNLDIAPMSLDGTSRSGRWEPADRALSSAMLTYWANFIKTGNPNGGGQAVWPVCRETARPPVMYFDDKPRAKPDKTASRMAIIDRALQPAM